MADPIPTSNDEAAMACRDLVEVLSFLEGLADRKDAFGADEAAVLESVRRRIDVLLLRTGSRRSP